MLAQARKSRFARTGQAIRAMEAVAVSIAQQEPVLLVGETGTGKTTLVQEIAGLVRLCCDDMLCSSLLYNLGMQWQ